jgi:hypothetical protein
MDELARRVGARLKAAKAILATAESCTGGWAAQAVTSVAGSSAWFDRGFISYSNAAKEELLGVRAETLRRPGAVLEGEIVPAGDRRRVQLRLSTQEVEIIGSPRYSRLTRGEGFFDAEHHPQVIFVSDAYPASLLRDGGQLAGQLTIRGTTRREVLTIEPVACERPGLDCDVLVSGHVYRGDFMMDRWSFALSDRVRLVLRLRTRGGGA